MRLLAREEGCEGRRRGVGGGDAGLGVSPRAASSATTSGAPRSRVPRRAAAAASRSTAASSSPSAWASWAATSATVLTTGPSRLVTAISAADRNNTRAFARSPAASSTCARTMST